MVDTREMTWWFVVTERQSQVEWNGGGLCEMVTKPLKSDALVTVASDFDRWFRSRKEKCWVVTVVDPTKT